MNKNQRGGKRKPQNQKRQRNNQQVVQKPRRRQRPQKQEANGGILSKLFKYGLKLGGPLVNHIFGSGDYITQNATNKNSLFSGENFQFKKTTTCISNREYLGDVVTSATAGAFSYLTYQINPGNPITFPWLSQIAQNFESYKMRGLVFEFKSMSADALNSTNTALGQVIMSTQYDAANLPFSNKQQQEQYDGSISVKPSQSILLGVECQPNLSVLPMLYINNATLPPHTAIQFVDMGVFQVSTNGMQGSSVNVGELWVTYDVELIHEKLNIDNDGSTYARYSVANPTTGFANLVANSTHQSGQALYLVNGFILLSGFPTGNYLLTILIQGSSLTSTSGTVSLVNGSTALNIFDGLTVAGNTTGSSTNIVTEFAFAIDNVITGSTAQGLAFSSYTWTGSATLADVIITSLANPA